METQSPRFLTKFARICDTVHIVIVTHAVYLYAVTNFSNPAALEEATLYFTLFFIESPWLT
jgi:hypothetical protein